MNKVLEPITFFLANPAVCGKWYKWGNHFDY